MRNTFRNYVAVVCALAIAAGSFGVVTAKGLLPTYKGEENFIENSFAGETEESVSTQQLPVTPVGSLVVTASALNVRKTPNGEIMGLVNRDDMCYVYGFSGNWLQILYNGQYGFVYSKYVKLFDFSLNSVSTEDMKAVFGANESLASKELTDADIAQINDMQSVYFETLKNAGLLEGKKTINGNVESEKEKEQEITQEDPVIGSPEDIAKQQAEALAALQAEQERQAQEAMKQQAEAIAALQAEQERQAQEAMKQQAEALAAFQAEQAKLLKAQQEAENKKQQLLSKNPNTLSTTELCQYVLYQIITPDMDDFAKARAINNWLCDHVTYDLNYYTTRDAILLGRGRCQGYANAYKNLMNTAGIPTDYISGYANGGRHGWNRVLIGGCYYYVDVTWNDSMRDYGRYLLVSEAEMNRDHQPNKINPKTE